ncbi:hypothetical protein D3C84_723460 [compost metagenome]
MLGVRQVHFIQHNRIWTLWVSAGPKQEIDECRSDIALAIQRIDVTKQARGIMPAWLDGNRKQALGRVGLPLVQRKRIPSSQYRLTGTTESGEHSKVTTRMTPKSGVKAGNQADRKGNIFGETTLDGFQRGSLEWHSLFTGWQYAG